MYLFPRALRALPAIALIALAGCGANPKPTSPAASSPSGPVSFGIDLPLPGGTGPRSPSILGGSAIFPLEPGRSWDYHWTIENTAVPNQGDPTTSRFEMLQTIELLCPVHDQRDYVVWFESFQPAGGGTPLPGSWFLVRQDSHGLYEKDFTGSGNPPCGQVVNASAQPTTRAPLEESWARLAATPQVRANPAAWERAWADIGRKTMAITPGLGAAGIPRIHPPLRQPPDGELLRLAYPLFVGQTWIVRPDPRFLSRAEAVETLQLPAGRFTGFRVHITSELFGPNDVVMTWWGRDGFLRLRAHVEGIATDENGQPIGKMISEEDQVLTAFHLPGPPR